MGMLVVVKYRIPGGRSDEIWRYYATIVPVAGDVIEFEDSRNYLVKSRTFIIEEESRAWCILQVVD